MPRIPMAQRSTQCAQIVHKAIDDLTTKNISSLFATPSLERAKPQLLSYDIELMQLEQLVTYNNEVTKNVSFYFQ
ncbi:10200_t:CDS:2 [Diversispora eburnea]|uniref:10200_t:CDS:1 n=1 Tax=Diversispora eburnea TaxID=1213867 RepID=A0A9N9GBV3_9GLOM|nr:10200_t:CDS:2 [Diversispora eburnea]